ncbi:MAG TPA: FAD-dependent thymidylate synthase [Candidatus Polarisedimenticolaceae bacterium]|nr:FAD-dependent thymidylate synthase [Candidatus Polarisedimenticolaceae bacterium]
MSETFTPAEREQLRPYFTDLDGTVFALVGLPEVVKGALFARYSRSGKSLRRLFLDEFLGPDSPLPQAAAEVGVERAERLYERVFSEYGDDSVAQLGGVHLACENVSNLLTKQLEWGRLAAYLEQSTRYISYADRPGGRWKYHVPAELDGSPLRERYERTLDAVFKTYAAWLEPLQEYFAALHPRADDVSPQVYKQTIRAKALDALRGLLPAATTANVGIFATGQAYEALLLRLGAHPLAESRACAERMLAELRKVIPAFVKRVDQPERGLAWSRYLGETRAATAAVAAELLAGTAPRPQPEVRLTEFDPEGEVKVVAAALYAVSNLPDEQLLERARAMSGEERLRVLRAYVGTRTNRRHKPGRAFERTGYRFDVLCDYGAFRDLQRHRLLTLEWQPLSVQHGYDVSPSIAAAGAGDAWRRAMEASADLYHALQNAGLEQVAPYAVCMAYRVRFHLQLNAREALHVIELRTGKQGHPSYRRVCQAMHRLIAEQAGHGAIAAAMHFADHGAVELERLEAERAAERRREERTPRA